MKNLLPLWGRRDILHPPKTMRTNYVTHALLIVVLALQITIIGLLVGRRETPLRPELVSLEYRPSEPEPETPVWF